MSDIAKMIAIAKKYGGSGSPSAPAPVVILSETALLELGGQLAIPTPPNELPENGKMYTVTYNGTPYDCPAAEFAEDGMSTFMFGNTSAMGVPGGNAAAPFIVGLFTEANEGMYGICMPMDGATSVTLSIVEAVSSGGDSDSGGVLTVRVDASSETEDMTLSNCDKTFAEFVNAYTAGKLIRVVAVVAALNVEYVGNVTYYKVSETGAPVFAISVPYASGLVNKFFLVMAGGDGFPTFISFGE